MNFGKSGTLYHIAIAVKNLEESVNLYKNILGLNVVHEEEVEEYGVKTVMLQPEGSSGTAIELLEPTSSDSSITKFLDKRGEGIHHICFFVDNIEQTLEKLKEDGVNLIDEKPRPGAYNSKVAFIHPKELNGVLVELAEMKK